jgi:hypothetical protein
MDENGFGRLTDLRSSDEPCRIPDGFKGWISPYGLRNADGTVAERDVFPAPSRRKPMSLPRQMPVLDDVPPVETVPSVAVPTDLPDLKAMIPADGKITGATVAMALVAVAGSGAVIKLVKDHLDRKADLKEKELDKQQNDHGQCEMARAADAEKTRAALAAVEERLGSLEGRVSTVESWRVRATKAIRDAAKKPKD